MITYITLKCDNCKQPFKRILTKHNQNIEVGRQHNFCSRKCKGLAENKRIETQCYLCQKGFKRTPKELKKSKSGNSFCSRSCAAKHNNRFKRQSRRSQIEIRFYNLLVKEFPQLNILPNDKTMLDGLEVDIAIPDLKLAIEWNGIVHFKPIYGQLKLNIVQNKDTEKLKIASNKNINLIVIPDLVSNDKILKQAFNNVKNIINKLLCINCSWQDSNLQTLHSKCSP